MLRSINLSILYISCLDTIASQTTFESWPMVTSFSFTPARSLFHSRWNSLFFWIVFLHILIVGLRHIQIAGEAQLPLLDEKDDTTPWLTRRSASERRKALVSRNVNEEKREKIKLSLKRIRGKKNYVSQRGNILSNGNYNGQGRHYDNHVLWRLIQEEKDISVRIL